MAAVGSANLDWKNIGFQVQETNGHAEFIWRNGAWGPGQLVKEPYIKLHVNSVGLHYGQTVWEGLKAFHCKDGAVRVFNDRENHARLSYGAQRMMLPEVSLEMFQAGLDMAIRANVSRMPPYGSGGALYLRPILFGSGPRLGLAPADEYHFLIIASPVGNYYATVGEDVLRRGVPARVQLAYDRAAARGTGSVKCPGNYGADLKPGADAKAEGFMATLYLDPVEQRYVEEFSVTNFVAITKDGSFITPESPSILASITNKCMMQLARDMGLKVEQRKIDFLAEVDTFDEVGGVGTAAVVLPVSSLQFRDKTFHFAQHRILRELHDQLLAIQRGDREDPHGWTRSVALQSRL